MKKLILALIGVSALGLNAQKSPQTTQQDPAISGVYTEMPNPVATDETAWQNLKKLQVGWGSTDVRYKKESPAQGLEQKMVLKAWRGERVSAQMVLSNAGGEQELSVEVADLKGSQGKISKENIQASFVRYVMTDELNKDRKGTCGYRKSKDYDSTLVADVLDHLSPKLNLKNKTSQGIWFKIAVPEDAKPGRYSTEISLKSGKKTLKKMPLVVEVSPRVLPKPQDWKFHLDLWQNPYAVARYHNVKLWSEEHLAILKKEMKLYAEAGGKSITASIMHKPWGGQTYDAFGSMVMWVKKLDGSWAFDFAVFDKWVELMHEVGINKQINCYSMVPWKLSFQYFDQATNQLQSIETDPSKPEYEAMWGEMLKAFAQHLKQKGWFEKTYISMDERPMEVMQQTFKIIKKADPNFKVSLAGALHDELEPHLDDYCVALRMKYTEETKQKRQKQGKVTTYYTSCEEPYPNTFTFSAPAESEWLAWYVAKENLDGYLRWAYNSWTAEPLKDSRFISWGAGDTYLVYPMGRSSIRFERLVEGIQSYEKIRILREEFSRKHQTEPLKKIEEVLQLFDEKTLPEKPASETIHRAKTLINGL